LDWDDEAGEGDAFTSLEQQLETEFVCAWLTWMRDVDVPWAPLFPHGPKSVRWGEEISMDNLEDYSSHSICELCSSGWQEKHR
jgi:hypothetical protein